MPTNTPQEMISATLERLVAHTEAVPPLADACSTLNRHAERVLASEIHGARLIPLGTELHALHALTEGALVRIIEQARTLAAQLGWQVATYLIAPYAKESGSEPIAWLTGNSYMPPLRAFSPSEAVWQLDAPDVWEAYYERIETRLAELEVYMAAPEYDNALYVVDLERFEYVGEDRDCDSLTDEWAAKTTAP